MKIKTVVLTGAAPIARDELKHKLKVLGIRVQGAVSTKTDLVVASRNDTVKARTARKMGVRTMSYPAFMRGLHIAA